MASRRLTIGVQLPEVERAVRWPEIRAMARAAEEGGFESVWVADHLLYRDDGRPERAPWDAGTQMAALAACTERVALGPLAAATAFHPPGLIARMAAMIDEVSGRRFLLGIGAGWKETESRALGAAARAHAAVILTARAPASDRRARAAELWAGGAEPRGVRRGPTTPTGLALVEGCTPGDRHRRGHRRKGEGRGAFSRGADAADCCRRWD